METTDIALINLGIISSSAYLLFIWFETNAIIEYAKILRLDSIFYTKEYEESLELAPDLPYSLFIVAHKDTFINRILSCPFCLCTWMMIYFSFVFFFALGFKVFGFIFLDWFAALFLYKASSNYFLK
jgi:hypothetical protein